MLDNFPQLQCDFCSAEDFKNALEVLKGCYFPQGGEGMRQGWFSPGANGEFYGGHWWSLDYALIADSAKWIDYNVALPLIDNLLDTQTENGRIKLYSIDNFDYFENVHEEISSLPKYIQTAYDLALMSDDPAVMEKAYRLITKGLSWWFEKRQDSETTLISAVFEETFIPNTVSGSMVYAPLDTNMEIIQACDKAASLAEMLEDRSAADFYNKKKKELESAVLKYLWCEEDGCFYPYVLTQKRQQKTLMATTFRGFPIADPKQKERLKDLLLDDSHFQWNTIPVTSVSKKDSLFTVTEGDYDGNPSWSGSVWTLLNYDVIRSLLDSGMKDTAAELALKTVKAFKGSYREFLNPLNGKGEGVKSYGWTASQFIRILIEVLLGVSYTAKDGLQVKPIIPDIMVLKGLALPDGTAVTILSENFHVLIEKVS